MIKFKQYRLYFIFFLFLLFLNFITPLVADDFGYLFIIGDSKVIGGVYDLLISTFNNYILWTGRLISDFIAQIFMLLGKPIFNLINSLAFMGLVILLFRISTYGKKISHRDFVLIALSLFLFVPSFGQVFLWLVGTANYLYPILFSVLFLYCYIKNKANMFILCLLAFIAGLGNENTSGATILIALLLFIFNSKKTFQRGLPLLFAICGFLILLFAPGNFVRLDAVVESTPFVVTLIKRGLHTTLMLSQFTLPIIIGYLILLVVSLRIKKLEANTIKDSFIFFVGAIAANFAMILSPSYQERSMLCVIIFMLIAFYMLFFPLFDSQDAYKEIIIVVAGVLVIFELIPGIVDMGYSLYRVQNRENEILRYKKEGYTHIEGLEYIGANSKFNAKYGLEDIDADKNFWVNKQMSMYYGVESIEAVEK